MTFGYNLGFWTFLTKEMNSLNCNNVNQFHLQYWSSDSEEFIIHGQTCKCQLLLSKGVVGGGAVGALKNSVNLTN